MLSVLIPGWALCGHEAAPGAAQAGAEGDGDAEAWEGDPASSSATGAAAEPLSQGQQQPAAAASGSAVAGSVADGHDLGSTKGLACNCCSNSSGNSSSRGLPHPHQQQQQEANSAVTAWHPAQALSAEERIQLGLRCKQLLDAGRCSWLQEKLAPLLQQSQRQQQLQQKALIPLQQEQAAAAGVQGGAELYVQRVAYIDESVSGENTLLVLGRRPH